MRVAVGRGLGLVCAGALALGLFACSDDDSKPEPDTDSGTDSGEPIEVDAGKPATDAAMADSAVVTMPTTFECGTNMCTVPDLGLGNLGALPLPVDPAALSGMGVMGCCTEDNACGVESATVLAGAGCLEQDQPGVPDDMCPAISSMIDFMGLITISADLPGCCTADGQCGINFADVALDLGPLGALLGGAIPNLDLGPGCVELSVAAQIMNPGGSISDAGTTEPIACGTSDGGTGNDGGN